MLSTESDQGRRQEAPAVAGPQCAAGADDCGGNAGTARAPQIRWQYSPIARSDENFPDRAAFRIDIRVQRSGSSHAVLTRSWQAT
jgi:hypothetical protein